ncbi:MAG TPA: ATP-binding protein [Streptosporangiaceae bacterium]|jgi:signal transduction histidine kinase|nr:ATP-binding protein [Streptosporangiaceae bacterium]
MIWVGVAGTAAVAIVAGVIAGLALTRLSASRQQVIAVADPAAIQALQLDASVINQETGIRGYALSGAASFLQPYSSGLAQQRKSEAALRGLTGDVPGARDDLAIVIRRISGWQVRYATPTIAQVRVAGKPVLSPTIDQGKAQFDALRASIAALQADIARYRQQALANLNGAGATLQTVVIAIGVGLLVILAVFVLVMRRAVVRPLVGLAADTQLATTGDFEHVVRAIGPRETTDLGTDVNRLRTGILAALTDSRAAEAEARAAEAELRELAGELQRSNRDLEQFAYVASHDLQEPLRKVATFCQLLQRRYSGQLDDKADLYIEYAVDGAKRMQQLINDLLAFSRVGRITGDMAPVPADEALQQAQATLSGPIRRARASIEAGSLPVVRAEPSLLSTVFQNLLGNALKFRGEDPPRISVLAEQDEGFWRFSVTDNGIGIAPEYDERIFVIFQRLHDRQTYSGTGIGLALCRKIVEYHGGRMWLDTRHSPGTRFCFTLPILDQEKETDE